MLATSPADGAFHFAETRAALCLRRSAASAGRPHGENVREEERRHPRGSDDSVPFAGVLGRGRLPRQSENAARVCSLGRARHRRRRGRRLAAGAADRQHGHASLRSAAAHGLFHEGRNLGEFVGAAEPHELRAGIDQRQNQGREGGRGATGGKWTPPPADAMATLWPRWRESLLAGRRVEADARLDRGADRRNRRRRMARREARQKGADRASSAARRTRA